MTTTAAPRTLAPLGATDLTRDIAGAAALLVSLALPWTLGVADAFAATRLDVLLVTLLTAFGAGVTFLVRSGALGAASIRTTLMIRLAFAVPYGVLVLVYVILALVNVLPSPGPAAGVGLAGVALIAQPRRSELAADPGSAPFAARTALIGLWLVVGTIGVLTLSGVIRIATLGIGAYWVVESIIAALVHGAACALLYLGTLRRSPSARAIGWVVALVAAPVILLSVPLGGILDSGITGYHVLPWLLLAAGVLCSPGVGLLLPTIPPLQFWFRTARTALLVTAIASGLLVVAALSRGITSGTNAGFVVVTVVCLVMAAAAALIARVRLVADPANSRPAVLGLTAAAAGLGFVAFVLTIIVRAITRLGQYADLMPPILPLTVVVAPAILVIVALTAPAAVRAYLTGAPIAADGSSAPAPLAPAADPSTPAEQLAALATDPANWVALAGNPATYPELLAYLAQHGDATVQQVLKARSLG